MRSTDVSLYLTGRKPSEATCARYKRNGSDDDVLMCMKTNMILSTLLALERNLVDLRIAGE